MKKKKNLIDFAKSVNYTSKMKEEGTHPQKTSNHPQKLARSKSVSNESHLLNLVGLNRRGSTTSNKKVVRPSSALSHLSSMSKPYARSPVITYTSPNKENQSQQVAQSYGLKFNPDSKSTSHQHSSSLQQASTVVDVRAAHNGSPLNTELEPHKEKFAPPNISPMYKREKPTPTAISTYSSTPLWDFSGEKKVRFLESEVTGAESSRPSSGTSTYSNIIKNSTKFSYVPTQANDIYGSIGHSAKICNCPCHFFPKYSQDVGIQVIRSEIEPQRAQRSQRPRHYRLFVVPSLKGFEHLSISSKLTTFIVRALLSQVGLTIVVIIWWLLGALIFSTIEGPLQKGHIEKMAVLRSDLVIELATELRQVKPYDAIWIKKIEEYMIRLEMVVLQAVKSGYTTHRFSWSIPDSFLYSVSITSLIGPGGLVIQSPMTKIFSLLYAFIGIPMLFMLMFNIAQTAREGLCWLWNWIRRRKEVTDINSNLATSNRLSNRVTLNSVEAGPSYERIPSLVSKIPMPQLSKVSVLENTLTGSKPESAVSRSLQSVTQNIEVNGSNATEEEDVSNVNVAASSSYLSKNNKSVKGNVTLEPAIRRTIDQNAESQILMCTVKKQSVPWFLLIIFPLFYLILGTTLLTISQNWNVISALFLIGNNMLSIDHGGLGNSHLLNSTTVTVLYAAFLWLGSVCVLIFLLGMWPSLKLFLVDVGKNLCVAKPIELTR